MNLINKIYNIIYFINNIMNKIIIISLDGNIGSGKSTLVNIIKRFRPEYCMLDEPVNEWNEIKDKDGVNLLENFYKDQQRWAYTFQNFAYHPSSPQTYPTYQTVDLS